MDYRNDENYRTAALDLYAQLEKEAFDSISPTLMRRKDQLENKTFLLAVVGEVKAGKSTFLNALLKDDVLPSDILQSTSSIIQIVKSERKYITITYANQTKETFYENIAERLKAKGSVQADEQDLPIVQLNKFLRCHWDSNAKFSRWTDAEFEQLCKNVSNSRNIESTNFAQKISLYLQKFCSLNFPDTIQIGFPLKYDFDGFTLVDTPGVNAIGGIEELTTAFLGQANAIIYLHPIKPIESKSFSSFLANVLPEYRKDTLMLVLSHAYEQTHEEIRKSLDEAKRIFSGIVPENIFAVDSLMELYREKIGNASDVEVEMLAAEDKKFKRLVADARTDSKGNIEKLLSIMDEEANFGSLRKRISKFSADAAAIQIGDVVRRIREVCDEIDSTLDEKVKTWESRIKSPQSFAALIEKARSEREKLKADLHETIEQWPSQFNLLSKDSEYARAYHKLIDEFVSEVEGKRFESSDTADTRDSFAEKVHADCQNKIDKLAHSIADDLNKAVALKQLDCDEKYTVKVPKISLTRIWDDARSAATKNIRKEVGAPGKWNTFLRFISPKRWGWGKTHKMVGEFDIGSYWECIKSDLIKEISAQRTAIAKHFDDMIVSFCEKYGAKISFELADMEKRIEELSSVKKKNEDLESELEGLKEKKAVMSVMLEKCRRQLGQL